MKRTIMLFAGILFFILSSRSGQQFGYNGRFVFARLALTL